MKIYMVGGAVRDKLLGREVRDIDWVVVGATPEQMLEKGFHKVGADFPVFLHPENRQEYALARTDRKSAIERGLQVHSDQDVTLEDDLLRRDLTINAMAMNASGQLFDPYGGAEDLNRKIFRHVGPSFSDDPLRVLRVARFCARHPDFSIAPETLSLMRKIASEGKLEKIAPERILAEICKGLMEDRPSQMLLALRECGALQSILPEVNALWGIPQTEKYHPEICTGAHICMVIDHAASINETLPVRFACLMHDLGKAITPKEILPKHIEHEIRGLDLVKNVCSRLKVSNEMSSLAKLVTLEHGNMHASLASGYKGLMRLLERCKAFSSPDRFQLALRACVCDARGRLGLEDQPYPQQDYLIGAMEAGRGVNLAPVIEDAKAKNLSGESIALLVYEARYHAVKSWYQDNCLDKRKGISP